MKSKTLLIAAAALAAGVMSSSAAVYSQNIVGYVNVVINGNGYSLLSNPFDNGAGNIGTNMVDPNLTLPNKSQILTWNGSTFNIATKQGGVWNANPILAPGTGFFVFTPATQTSNLTNTLVGTVIVPSGGSITNQIPSGYSMWGSLIPYAGDLTTSTNLNIAPSLLVNKSQLMTWNGATYNIATLQGGIWNAASTVNVGDGFFVYSKATYSTNWIQNASY